MYAKIFTGETHPLQGNDALTHSTILVRTDAVFMMSIKTHTHTQKTLLLRSRLVQRSPVKTKKPQSRDERSETKLPVFNL